MKQETINVICIVTPDGQVFYREMQDGDNTPHVAQKIWRAWENSVPASRHDVYAAADVLGGVIAMRMLREDYQKIPATSQSAAIFAAAGL